MSANSSDWACYEQPLGERVRTMLRLEHVFRRAERSLRGDDVWSSRATVESLIDIIAVLGRADLKKDLIKELERHAATLESLSSNPNVDPGRLAEVQESISSLVARMKGSELGFGHALRNNELFNAVRQRSSIPAGTCDFDLPVYHHWLLSPAERRRQDLTAWLGSFDLLQEAVGLCLKMVRETGVSSDETAQGGLFQRTLESNTPWQMIRVCVRGSDDHYPEISAGRHRFTVRFMCQHDVRERPVQVQEDVRFRLVCCVI